MTDWTCNSLAFFSEWMWRTPSVAAVGARMCPSLKELAWPKVMLTDNIASGVAANAEFGRRIEDKYGEGGGLLCFEV